MERHAVPAYLILVAQELRREDEALVRLEEALTSNRAAPPTKAQLEAVVSGARSALCYMADVALVLAVMLEEEKKQLPPQQPPQPNTLSRNGDTKG